MFATIIVGITGQEHDDESLALAERLADPGAKIIAASVAVLDPHASRASSRDFDAALVQVAEETVARVTSGREGLHGSSIAAPSVGRGLQQLAQQHDADLIVVGSSRRGWLGRIFAGDDATDAVKHAPCPIAVAPKGFSQPIGPLSALGVGFDGSSDADLALVAAKALAARDGASLDVIDVIEPYDLGYTPGGYVGELSEAERERAQAQLAEAGEGSDVRTDVLTGSPAAALNKLSRTVDLVVIGSSHRPLIDRILIGSTASTLLRTMNGPLLIIPNDAAK